MNERTYTIVEETLPGGTSHWEVVVDGYGLTGGMTLDIAISNLCSPHINYAAAEEWKDD